MRTPFRTVVEICNGPVHLIENNDAMVIGNSQALALDLRQAVELLHEYVMSSPEEVVALKRKAIKFLKADK